MNLVAAITLLAAAISLGLGFYVLSRDPKRRMNQVFFAITVALVMWGIGDIVSVSTSTFSAIMLGRKLSFTGWCFIGALFLHFTLELTHKDRLLGKWWTYAALYTPFVAFLVLGWVTPLVFDSIVATGQGNKVVEGPLWKPVYALVILLMLAGIALMIVYRRKTEDTAEREQTGYVIVAALIPLVGSLVTEWMIPYSGMRPPVNALTLTIAMAALIAYAVSRRGLMSTLLNALGATVVGVMNDPVVILDSSGSIEVVNPAAVELTGYSQKELQGSTLDRLLARERRGSELVPLITRGKNVNVTTECLLESGEMIPVGVASGPVRSRSGRLIGSFVIIHDMRAAMELIRSEERARTATMEAEIEKRHSEELRNIIDVAEHELRHPAAVFKGYSTTLLSEWKTLDGETREDLLTEIDKAADRLTRLAADLQDTSHIESGGMLLSYGRESALTLIEQAVAKMRSRGYENEFNVTADGGLPYLEVDAEKIGAVLAILLDNAVKFSPEASPIDVYCVPAGEETVIAVADRGRGVPEEHREMIFTRFHQVDDVIHHSLPGLGLGLYIAARIVAAHGGWINVEPRDGGGSVFSMGLPTIPAVRQPGG